MPSIHPLTSRAHRVEAKYNVVTEFPNLRLHSAAAKGDIGSVQYALTHGQPANSVLDGILPLHAACSGGSELVVKLLLDFGADVNAPRLPRRYSDKKTEGGTIIGSSGSTPLHFAAANGHLNIVRILLQSGADPARADKHGTKPETLAVNFGHDEVAAMLREWEAAHPPMDPTPGSSTIAPIADGPPSPSRSRRLQVKRSLENLLTRKGHGMTAAHTHPGIQSLSPLQLDATSPFSTIGGSMTPASSSSDAFGIYPSGSRRPSLPHIFECHPPPPSSPNKKLSHRPRSAGGDDDPPMSNGASTGTLPPVHTHGPRRFASKMSLFNLFKKPPEASGGIYSGAHGASSPNLLEFLSQPVEVIRSRPRSSIEEVRMAPNPRLSLDRERQSIPTTAPAQRTAFFNQSPDGQHEADPVGPLPSTMLPRTTRSSSQTRPGIGPDHRSRTDSNATMSSSASSFDTHPAFSTSPAGLQSVALHNNWARAKRDRSASEGAGAIGKRSPLMMEWVRDDSGNVAKRDLPGVIADDDEDSSIGGPDRATAASPEQMGSPERIDRQPPPSSAVPRRPSLTNAVGDSSGPGHNRTNSAQSTKNLRFELPITESPVSASKLATSPPLSSVSQTPSTASTATPPLSKRKSLRACASAGSLPKNGAPLTLDGKAGRPYSIEGSKKFGSFLDFDEAEERSKYDTDEAEDAGIAEAEAGDSVGEPVWEKPPFAKSGSLNSSTSRPSVSTVSSPNGTINSPASSVASPSNPTKSYTSLSLTAPVKATPPVTEVDTRLRGASVSSSKSTDTSTSSANPQANGGSDSSGLLPRPPGWSTGTSTASVGTSANSTLRASKLDPIAAPPAYRHSYQLDGYDSSSSEKYSKTSPPMPVLIRSVNSHAQAHALVEKTQKEILDLADLSPDSAGLTGEALSAQLAAFGETLALEKRFARGEAQKSMWINRKGLEDDSDEDDGEVAWDEEKTKYPRGVAEAFTPQMKRKMSNPALNGISTSPVLQKMGSLEFSSTLSKARGTNRSRPVRGRVPVKSHTSPASPHTPMRTTPSNVGPPVDIKTPRVGSDEAHHLSHLVLHGIEITKTLPTPTDSPQSGVDLAALQASGRNVGVDEAAESPTGNESGSSVPKSAPINNSRSPEITVSDFQPVPLSRVNTAPSPTEKSATLPSRGHGRTASSGSGIVLMGPSDYIPPRSESRIGKRFGGLKSLVQTLKGK